MYTYVERKNEASSPDFCCRNKARSTEHFERCLYSCLSCPAFKAHASHNMGHLWPVRIHYTFALYCIHLTIFGKHLLNLQYVVWSSLQHVSQEFLILRRPEGDTIINIIDRHVKCPLFLWDFNETRIFPNDSWKIFKYHISRKLVQWEPSCSIMTEGRMEDGQTDRETRRN
jgi:hypothetical protein